MESTTFKFNPNAVEFNPGQFFNKSGKEDEELDEIGKKLETMNWYDDGSGAKQDPEAHSTLEIPSPTSVESETPKSPTQTDVKKADVPDPDPRPHLNIVFIGHIDAGKSTTCGNLLYKTGYVDERTIEKYEKEAIDKGRDSWFLAFIMDTNEEERAKGKTVEVGRASIETTNRRFTILDAPGHRSFVPNMIGGATQADVAVLIISARKGEFETGFDRGGQTREHALLAYTLGVKQMIVAVNKMDDPSCNWSEERYTSICTKLKPYLKKCGYFENRDVSFIPISGLTGQNIVDHVSDPSYKNYDERAKWYGLSEPTLLQLLDNIPPPERDETAPLRIPLIDGYRDNGIMCLGKVESGTVRYGADCLIMPNRVKAKIANVYFDDNEYAYAKPGENIRLRLLGVEDEQVSKGFVICDIAHPCPVSNKFVVQLAIIELHPHRPIMTSGYTCILHVHTIFDEVELVQILDCTDRKTKKKQIKPAFVKQDYIINAILRLENHYCVEAFENYPAMARVTLRDEGKTVAIGKITKILSD